jgi:hypothetical protein
MVAYRNFRNRPTSAFAYIDNINVELRAFKFWRSLHYISQRKLLPAAEFCAAFRQWELLFAPAVGKNVAALECDGSRSEARV